MELSENELETIIYLIENKIEEPPACAGNDEQKCKKCCLFKSKSCMYHESKLLHPKISALLEND